MAWPWLVAGGMTMGAIAMLLAWRPARRFGREVQAERARELYRLQRERLETQFFSAAAATGKPRGLRWVGCDFEEGLELVRDRRSGQLVGLVAVTIRFEAVEGSDMEGLPAVGNLRHASAVFYIERGQWNTVGKAVFNMSPAEALEHFHNQYERVV